MTYPNCPKCKHPVSEHYAGCMVIVGESYDVDKYCDCDEQFNLATGGRYPNRQELIELLERAADTLQNYAADESYQNDSLAMEIKRRLEGKE